MSLVEIALLAVTGSPGEDERTGRLRRKPKASHRRDTGVVPQFPYSNQIDGLDAAGVQGWRPQGTAVPWFRECTVQAAGPGRLTESPLIPYRREESGLTIWTTGPGNCAKPIRRVQIERGGCLRDCSAQHELHISVLWAGRPGAPWCLADWRAPSEPNDDVHVSRRPLNKVASDGTFQSSPRCVCSAFIAQNARQRISNCDRLFPIRVDNAVSTAQNRKG